MPLDPHIEVAKEIEAAFNSAPFKVAWGFLEKVIAADVDVLDRETRASSDNQLFKAGMACGLRAYLAKPSILANKVSSRIKQLQKEKAEEEKEKQQFEALLEEP